MNPEESIALARRLEKEYGDLEKIYKKICDHEAILSRADTDEPKKVGDYVNDFAVAGVKVFLGLVAVFVVLYIDGIIYLGATYSTWENGTNAQDVATGWLVFANIALLIIVIVIKDVRKKRKKEREKLQKVIETEAKIRRREEIQKNLNELLKEWNEGKERLSEFDTLVPAEMQTSYHMRRVRKKIMSKREKDFSEAVAIIAAKIHSEGIQKCR